MAFRELRRYTLLVFAVALPLGFVAGYVGVGPQAMLVVTLALTGAVAAGCWGYKRYLERSGRYDERHEQIMLRAANGTLIALYVALLPLALTELLLDVDLPTGWLLLGVVFVSSVLYELLVEYYRRQT